MKSAKIALITWILGAALLASGASAWAQGPVDIGLAPAKKAQLKAFAAKVKQRAQLERRTLKRSRVDLARAYSEYAIDPQQVKTAETAVAAAQLDLLNMHLENQIALRKILNQDQFGRFNEMIKSRMQRRREGLPEEAAESFTDRLTDPAMIAKINITPDEARRLRAMPDKKKMIDKLRGDISKLIALYDNYNLDVNAAKKQMDVVHSDQTQMAAVTHRRQQLLRSVLTADEFNRLKTTVITHMPKPSGPQPFRGPR